MGNQNDTRIMGLKDSIKETKKSIKSKRFQPITNCLIGIDGITYNIHVCGEDDLKLMLIKLNGYKMSAKDLGMDVPNMQGYSIDDWMQDIRDKIEIIESQNRRNALNKAEKQLDNLLSNDKRTELEIDNIADTLKNLLQ